MSSVDDRIVNMKFNNKQFIAGARESVEALEQVEGSLQSLAGSEGLKTIEHDIQKVAPRFSAMQVVAATALGKLTTVAMSASKKVISSLTAPFTVGGKQRALNIEQGKFQLRGLSLDVEAFTEAANNAVTGTAYGLDEALKLASQFGAAGMKDTSKVESALRGVAGAASMTGSSFSEIGSIFKSVAGEGVLSAVRVEQFGSRGLNAWQALAEGMGKTEPEIRKMVKERQITFEEFASVMDNQFGEHAAKANDTYTGALANFRAGFSRIGADFIAPKLEQLRKMMLAIVPVVNKIRATVQPLTKMYGNWYKEMYRLVKLFFGQFYDLDKAGQPVIGAFENLYRVFQQFRYIVYDFRKLGVHVAKTFGAAWTEVFGGSGSGMLVLLGDNLKALRKQTQAFRHFIRDSGALDGLHKIFVAFFTMIKVGGQGVGAVFGAVTGLIKSVYQAVQNVRGGGGVEGFLEPFMALDTDFKRIVSSILSVFATLTSPLQGVSDKFKNLSSAFDRSIADDIEAGFGKITGIFSSAKDGSDKLTASVEGGFGRLGAVFDFIKSIVSKAAGAIGSLVTKFMGAFQGMDLMDMAIMMNMITNALFSISMFRVSGSVSKTIGSFSQWGDIGGSVKESFDAIRDGIKGLGDQVNQEETWIDKLRSIAISIALLAAAVLLLAFIPEENLIRGTAAIATLMGLIYMMADGMVDIDNKIKGSAGSFRANVIVFAISVAIIAAALMMLAVAVAMFGAMPMDHMARGILGVIASLAVLSAALTLFAILPEGAIQKASRAILAISFSLIVMAGALYLFSKLDVGWEEFAAIGASLLLLAGVIAILGLIKEGPIARAGMAMILVASALMIIAGALKLLSKIDPEQLGIGFAVLFGILILITASLVILSAMKGSVTGAGAAILMVAIAISILVPVLITLGLLPFGVISAGLLALAAALLIIVAAAMLLASFPLAIAALYGLATVIIAIGGSIFLAGAGVALFATGLGILAVVGVAAFAVLAVGIKLFISMFPLMAVEMAASLILFIEVIAKAADRIGKAFVKIMVAMADAIIGSLDAFGSVLDKLMSFLLERILSWTTDIVDTGWQILLHFLSAFDDNLPEVLERATNIATTFIEGMANSAVKLAEAGLDALLAIVNGLADAIDTRRRDIEDAMKNLATALFDAFKAAFTGLMGGWVPDLPGVGELASRAKSGLSKILPGGGDEEEEVGHAQSQFSIAPLNSRQGIAAGAFAKMLPKSFENLAGVVTAKVDKKFQKTTANVLEKMMKTILTGMSRVEGEVNKWIRNSRRKALKSEGAAVFRETSSDILGRDADRAAKRQQRAEGRAKRLRDKLEKDKEELSKKERQDLRKRARAHEKEADNQEKTNKALTRQRARVDRKAEKARAKADKRRERADWVRDYVRADDATKASMQQDRSIDLSEEANTLFAESQAHMSAAARLAESDAKESKKREKEGRRLARLARKAAVKAEEAQRAYFRIFGEILTDRRDSILQDRKDRKAELAEEEAFRNADDVGKAEIMDARAERARQRNAEAERLFDKHMKDAAALMDTDPEAAAALLDAAEEQMAIADKAAEDARQYAEEAAGYRDTEEEAESSSTSKGQGFVPSRTALEDAARTVDAQTASQRQAAELAAAQQPIQFVQNNTSPKALSTSEIYRQSKNLVSIGAPSLG